MECLGWFYCNSKKYAVVKISVFVILYFLDSLCDTSQQIKFFLRESTSIYLQTFARSWKSFKFISLPKFIPQISLSFSWNRSFLRVYKKVLEKSFSFSWIKRFVLWVVVKLFTWFDCHNGLCLAGMRVIKHLTNI